MEKETKETQKKAAPSSQAAAMRNDTIDLVELAYVLLRRWKMLVLFTVVGALLAGCLPPVPGEAYLSGGCIHLHHQYGLCDHNL